jgi:hypothetical protein
MDKTDRHIDLLVSQIKQLERSLQKVASKALDIEPLIAAPRLTLHGFFVGFHADTQTLEIRIPGESEHYFYPLSHYDGEWLPIPGQQVIVTRSSRGAPLWGLRTREHENTTSATWPRIIGFTRGGQSIPPAPVASLKVIEYNCAERTLRLRSAADEELVLTLPGAFDAIYDPDIRFGQVLHFRMIDVFPGRYYIPIQLPGEEDQSDPLVDIISAMEN